MFCEILFLLIEIEFSFRALLASLTDLRKFVSVARRFSTSIPFNNFSLDILELGTPSKISLKVLSSRDSRSSLLDFQKRTFDALIAFFKSFSP